MEKQISDGLVALAKAVSLIGPISKNKTAKVPTKSGGYYIYHYADLPSILEAVKEPLAAAGIFVSQNISLDETALITQFIYIPTGVVVSESRYPLVFDSDPQKIGSAITYARRYSLCVMLNIAPEDDDDGNTAKGSPPDGVESKNQLKSVPKPDQRPIPTPRPQPTPIRPTATADVPTMDYQEQPGSPGDFKVPYGRDKGKPIRMLHTSQINGDIEYWSQAKKSSKGIPPLADDYLINLIAYLEWTRTAHPVQPGPDFESFDMGDEAL